MNNSAKFKFNLVTPITQEEIQVIEERDSTIVNSFILIFASAFVFCVLVLLNVVFIDRAVANSHQVLDQKRTAMSQFNDIRTLHGEFVVKSRSLSPLLDLDIKPDKLVSIVDRLVNALSAELSVESFGRDRSGLFVIQAYVTNLESLTLIEDFFNQNSNEVTDMFIGQVLNTRDGRLVSISFNIVI